ncbi:hypothetical protein [Bradyrhizobium sp. USDA 4369]
MLVVSFGIVDHVPQQSFSGVLVAFGVQQPDKALAAVGRPAETIKPFGETCIAVLLEKLSDLTRGAGRKVGGVIGCPRRTVQDLRDRPLVDVGGLQLDAVQHLAVMKARTCFVGVGEARAERRLLVGAEDAEIAQREVLETIGGLAEIEIQQKFDRPCVVERYEASGAAILRGKIEGDCCDEEVGQRRFRPGRADLAAKSGRTGTVEERRLGQAEHEG